MTQVPQETLEKLLFAYNPGPGWISYPSPARDEVPELVLEPYKHTAVHRAYLNQAAFRRDWKAERFTLVEADDQPEDPDRSVSEKYDLRPDLRAFVHRLCTEEFTPQFEAAIQLSKMVAANGRPLQNSRVTAQYLREVHAVTLQAALELENRWRKRKPVLKALQDELKKIEKLGKYV